MICDKAANLTTQFQRSELELTVALKNYQCTGLSRYRTYVTECRKVLSEVESQLDQHHRSCPLCKLIWWCHALW